VSVSNVVISNQTESPKSVDTSQQKNRYKKLEFLDGIKLTTREIDVLSCILFGRSAKIIASYLSISPRTVEGYWDNLLKKLHCNSRQQIINKLEQSKNLEIFRQHYTLITQQSVFEKNLITLKSFLEIIKPQIKIIYAQNHISLNRLENDLSKVSVLSSREKSSIEESEFIVCEVSWEEKKDLKKTITKIPFETLEQNYFLCFFSLFQNLIPEATFQSLSNIFNSSSMDFKEKKNISDNIHINFQTKPKTQIKKPMLLFCCLSTLLGALLYAILYQQPAEKDLFSNIEHELIDKSLFLDRPELLKKIQISLNTQKGIKIAMLIGPGGAGKTTMACSYAHDQTPPFIYKINGESRTDVITSFREIGFALSKTKIDLEEFDTILKILDTEDRRKKIIDFVRKKLRSIKNWCLIYDNLNNFDLVADYFPRDQNLWGLGTVLITTQNANLSNTGYFSQIKTIHIKDLTHADSLLLFKKIVAYSEHPIILDPKILDAFLKKVPPFPLDVSLIAHYIKNASQQAGFSPESLDQENESKAFLKDFERDHASSRYNLMKTAFQQICLQSRDFQELLTLCVLINSHKIPISLLYSLKDESIVRQYISMLNKYSLITNHEYLKNTENYISIHPTTKNYLLEYLVKDLKIQKDSPKLKFLIKSIALYLEQKINKDQYQAVEVFLPHLEALSAQKQIFLQEDKQEILLLLGYAHLYLRNYKKAMEIFYSNIKELESCKRTHSDIYRKNLSLLGVTYRFTFDLKKAEKYLDLGLPKLPNKNFDIFTTRLILEKAKIYRSLGKYHQSIVLLEQCLDIFTKQFPEQHVILAFILTDIGMIHRILGNYTKASEIFERSLSVNKNHLKSNAATYAWLLTQIGSLNRGIGDYLRAEKILLESEKLFRGKFSEYKELRAHSLTALGFVYSKLGKYDKAFTALDESYKIYEKYFSVDNPRNAWNLVQLGILKRKQGKLKEAEELIQKGEQIFLTAFSKNHVERGWALAHLGIVCRENKKFEEALAYFNLSNNIFKITLPSNHALISWQMMHTALTYLTLKDNEKALKHGTKSYTQFKEIFGISSTQTAAAAIKLAQIYIEVGEKEEAIKLLKSSLHAYNTYYKNSNYPEYKKIYLLLNKLKQLP